MDLDQPVPLWGPPIFLLLVLAWSFVRGSLEEHREGRLAPPGKIPLLPFSGEGEQIAYAIGWCDLGIGLYLYVWFELPWWLALIAALPLALLLYTVVGVLLLLGARFLVFMIHRLVPPGDR